MLTSLTQSIIVYISFLLKKTVLVDAVCQSFCNVPSPWIELESHICYENTGRKPATITFKQDCNLYAIRLQHLSGFISCGEGRESWWGCLPKQTKVAFILSDPKTENIWFPDGAKSVFDASYEINGFNSEDDVIVVKKRSNFTAGDKLQVWDREDWFRFSLGDNAGKHCISVDVSCFV